MLELAPERDNIYEFIGEKLKEIAGNAVVLINSFDESSATFRPRAALGISEEEGQIIDILGEQLVGLTTPISDEARAGLTSGRLEKVAGGIYALAAGGIPEAVCREIENLLDVGEAYAIGFSWGGELFGSAVVLMRRGAGLRKPHIIEIIVHQASLVLQRWQAEKSLRESEEKHRTLFETMTQGVVYYDSEMKVISKNKAAEKILGIKIYEKQLIEPRAPGVYIIREDGSDFPRQEYPVFVALRTGKECRNIVMGVYNPEKHDYVWININVIPQFRPGEDKPFRVYTIFEDITELKRAERTLRESEEKHRALVDAAGKAGEGIAIVQNLGGKEAAFVFVNDEFCMMAGYSREELLTMKAQDLVNPDEFREVSDKYTRRQKGENVPARYELTFVRKDGTLVPVEAGFDVMDYSGKVATVAFLRDITERKKMEEALQERMRFETLLSDLSAAFVNMPSDKVEEGIVRWLQRLVEFLDVDRSTIIELSEDDTKLYPTLSYAAPGIEPIPSMAMDELFPWYAEKIRRGETMIMGNTDDLPEEAKNEKAYGVLIGMRSNLTIPLQIGGKIMGAIAFGVFQRKRSWSGELVSRVQLIGEIFANTLMRKRAEEALRRIEQTIRELAQEAAQAHERERERLALEVHDRISQNLTAVFYQLKTLECYPLQDAAAQQALLRASTLMKECIGESRNLMEDLYSPVLSDFGIVAVIDDELRRFKEDTGCEAKFHAVCPVRPPIETESNMYRIFREAMTNIRRHATGAKHVEVSFVCKGGLDSLMVYDNGLGFDVESALSRKQVGGLSGMRRRAEIAGGTCNIESGADRGTTVSVTLPYKPAPTVEQEKA